MVRAYALAAALAVALPIAVNAHGSISYPKVAFNDIYNKNAPSGFSPGNPGPYSGSKDLKGQAEAAGSHCGKTKSNGPAQPIPADGMVKFDISAQHIGPCEIWLDDKKVMYADDCWKKFPNHKIPVDFSKCSGGCKLRWVWIATHTSPWEYFDNCVNLKGGGGSKPKPKPKPKPNKSKPKPKSKSKPKPKPKPKPKSKPKPKKKPAPKPKPAGGGGRYVYVGGSHDAAAMTTWCNQNCPAFCPSDVCKRG